MNPHLSYIKEKCRLANPNIIKFPTQIGDRFLKTGNIEHFWEFEDFYQLSDVLVALGKGYGIIEKTFVKWNENSEQFEMYQDDEFGEHDYDYPEYDCSKPLSEQSPETLEWIAVQLGYKE